MEAVDKKVLFNAGGSGGYTVRVGLPIDFVNALGITKDENDVKVYLDGDKIIIKKDVE